jgi:electron transfer flavoprotein beta subunit
VKILVTAKRVPDPEQKLKFKGSALDLSGVNWVLNPFDEYAVEAALRLIENAATSEKQGEVVVVSIGPKEVAQQIRSALAMGADRGIRVEGDDEQLDSEQVARIFQKLCEREKPDLVLMGKQAVDGDDNQVPQLLAGYLGLPQACFAATIEVAGTALVIGREVDAGVETKKVPLPAVVSVDLRIVAPKGVVNHKTPDTHTYAEGPRYASLKGIMAAKKKPLEETDAAKLGVTLAPRVKVLSVEAPPQRKAGIKVGSVDELWAKLKNEAKVL